MNIEFFILVLCSLFCCICLMRAVMCLSWINKMAEKVISDVGLGKYDFSWFSDFDVYSIFNPLHWDKWTSKQWIKYLKSKYNKE